MSLMHVIVPLCMMTWSNTLVYSCECVVCFVLCFYLMNVFFYVSCVVWHLLTCSTFRCSWCRDWISRMNMYVVCMCMYVCMCVCVYVCMCVCVCMYAYMYICVCVRMYVCVYALCMYVQTSMLGNMAI